VDDGQTVRAVRTAEPDCPPRDGAAIIFEAVLESVWPFAVNRCR
jgi:hypothetical protein